MYLSHILRVMKGVLEAQVAQVDRSVLVCLNLGYLVLQGGLVAQSWSLLWGPERGSYRLLFSHHNDDTLCRHGNLTHHWSWPPRDAWWSAITCLPFVSLHSLDSLLTFCPL